MKITVSKNIDVDLEVDVGLEDLLDEFTCMLTEDPVGRRAKIIPDACTRLLAKIPDELIDQYDERAHAEVRRRLINELARWNKVDPRSMEAEG